MAQSLEEEPAGTADEPGDAASSPAQRRPRGPVLRRMQASDTAAAPSALERLGKDKRWDVRARVARNPTTPHRVFRQLTHDGTWSVRASCAEVARDPEDIELLCNDDARVLFALAANPHLGDVPSALTSLMSEGDPYVTGRCLSNPSLTAVQISEAVARLDLPAWALRAAAANPACPPELSDELLTWIALGGAGPGDPTFDPVQCVGNPEDAAVADWSFFYALSMKRYAVKSPLWRARAQMTEFQPTSLEVLETLARDPHPAVRGSVAGLVELPMSALKELEDDADDDIATFATAARKARRKHNLREQRHVFLDRFPKAALIAAPVLLAIGLMFSGGSGGDGKTPGSEVLESLADLSEQQALPTVEEIASTPAASVVGDELRLGTHGTLVTIESDSTVTDLTLQFTAGDQGLTVDQVSVRLYFDDSFGIEQFSLLPGESRAFLVDAKGTPIIGVHVVVDGTTYTEPTYDKELGLVR